jgi:hypothetical protein
MLELCNPHPNCFADFSPKPNSKVITLGFLLFVTLGTDQPPQNLAAGMLNRGNPTAFNLCEIRDKQFPGLRLTFGAFIMNSPDEKDG